MQVKNIIIFNDYANPNGGTSKVACDTAIAFAKIGINVVFVCGSGPIYRLFDKYNINPICLGQPDLLSDKSKVKAACRGLWNLKAYRCTRLLLKKYSASDTIVMVHSYSKILSSSIYTALKKSDFKVLVTLHDYFQACPNGGFRNYKKHVNCSFCPMSLKCLLSNCDSRSYSQKLYRCLRQIVLNSNMKGNKENLIALNVSDMSGTLLKPYIANRFSIYKTLLNPVDLSNDEYVDITKNSSYIFIGRLSEEKGIRDFCRVMTDLSLQGVVLGDGYLRNEMEKLYPNVDFVGWADSEKKIKYIRQAKCLIFPSNVYETFGLSVAEVLSYGIPCIVPKECGCSYLIKEGENGLIYTIGDYSELKSRVLKFEQLDLYKIMQTTRSSFDRKSLSVDAYIERVFKIIECIK